MKTSTKVKKYVYLVTIIIFISLPPYLIQKLYEELNKNKIGTFISASDVLAYLGTIIGLIGAVSSALIAIKSEQKMWVQQKEEEANKHRQKIKPHLILKITPNGEEPYNTFLLEISNLNASPAIFVCIEDQFVFYTIKCGETKKRQVEFKHTDDGETFYLYFDEKSLNPDGVPQKITLYYKDIDRNIIEEEFIYINHGKYGDKGYCYL